MRVEFNSKERLILLDALLSDPYVKRMQEAPPQVTAVYDNIIDKLTTKEVEATEGKPVHAITILRKEINFINFKLAEMNAKEKAVATDAMIDLDRARAYLEDL